MTPYNEKIWATPLDRMSAGWIGERVARPVWETILERTCREQDAEPWGPNAQFRYPATGGSGRVWRETSLRIPKRHKRFHEAVLEIDADEKLIVTDRGRRYRYQHLVSTMPADQLLQLLTTKRQLPSAGRLQHTTTHLRGFGLPGAPPASLRDRLWVYFAQPDVCFYRMTLLSNLSPAMVPDSQSTWSVVVEVAESRWKPLTEKNLTQRVLDDLRQLGFVEEHTVPLSTWERTLPYGYPIPTLDRDRTLAGVLPALEQLGIYSRGRFGAWKYEVSNQDHSFMQGVEAIERIVNDREELTLHHADLINSRNNVFPYPEWGRRKA
jgi:protoporphyrinogen oxidase